MRYKVSWILPTAVSHVKGEPLLSCSPNKLMQIVWLQDWCRQDRYVKLPDYTRAKHLWLQSEGNAVSHTSTSLL